MPRPSSVRPCGLRRLRHDIVAAQQLDLVRRQLQRARRELQENRLQPGEAERQRHQHAVAVGDLQDEFHDFAQGQHFRPAELVGRARLGLAVDGVRNRGCDIADIDRLHLVVPPPISGSAGEIRASAAKRLVN